MNLKKELDKSFSNWMQMLTMLSYISYLDRKDEEYKRRLFVEKYSTKGGIMKGINHKKQLEEKQ